MQDYLKRVQSRRRDILDLLFTMTFNGKINIINL